MIYSYMKEKGKITIYSRVCSKCNNEVQESDGECSNCGHTLLKRGAMAPFKSSLPPHEYICMFCGLEVRRYEEHCPHCDVELDWRKL